MLSLNSLTREPGKIWKTYKNNASGKIFMHLQHVYKALQAFLYYAEKYI